MIPLAEVRDPLYRSHHASRVNLESIMGPVALTDAKNVDAVCDMDFGVHLVKQTRRLCLRMTSKCLILRVIARDLIAHDQEQLWAAVR